MEFSIRGVKYVNKMKLLQALREKIYEEQAKIADSFAKAENIYCFSENVNCVINVLP